MYKEIHPYYNDTREPDLEKCYKPCKQPVLIKLENIDEIIPTVNDGLKCLVIDKSVDNYIVNDAEAAEIREILLKKSPESQLAREVSSLTSAVRDLWSLLRTRMH